MLSILPVATVLSIPSHSTHNNHPVCPARVYFGVSVSKSQIRHVLSPDPVARRRPVGEKEAHRMGDECPSIELLQRVISRTRKTASGSHSMMKTSSVLTRVECLRRRSAWIELWIEILGASSGATPSTGFVVEGRLR